MIRAGRLTSAPTIQGRSRANCMDSFSEQLRREAEPVWERVFSHPFLREIKDGTLPLEKFRYYLGQD